MSYLASKPFRLPSLPRQHGLLLPVPSALPFAELKISCHFQLLFSLSPTHNPTPNRALSACRVPRFTLHHRHPNPTSLLVHLRIHLPDNSTSPFPVCPWVVVAWIDFCCLPLVLIALNPEILWFLSLTQHWVQTFKVFVHYALNSCVNNSTLPQPAPNLTTPHFLFTFLFF